MNGILLHIYNFETGELAVRMLYGDNELERCFIINWINT